MKDIEYTLNEKHLQVLKADRSGKHESFIDIKSGIRVGFFTGELDSRGNEVYCFSLMVEPIGGDKWKLVKLKESKEVGANGYPVCVRLDDSPINSSECVVVGVYHGDTLNSEPKYLMDSKILSPYKEPEMIPHKLTNNEKSELMLKHRYPDEPLALDAYTGDKLTPEIELAVAQAVEELKSGKPTIN